MNLRLNNKIENVNCSWTSYSVVCFNGTVYDAAMYSWNVLFFSYTPVIKKQDISPPKHVSNLNTFLLINTSTNSESYAKVNQSNQHPCCKGVKVRDIWHWTPPISWQHLICGNISAVITTKSSESCQCFLLLQDNNYLWALFTLIVCDSAFDIGV